MVDQYEQVGDVRIAGAFMGIEFVTDRDTIAPAPAFHREVHHELMRRGVLGITQWGKWVYRMQPALNMPPELFRWSCDQVRDAVDEVSRRPPKEPQILDRWQNESRRVRG
jgi:4-aminobutyrate aminotransferase-like enzyme